MRFGLEEPNWGFVAARLAQGDADQQATFFKAFLRECATWGTRYQVEQQLAAVNFKLTPNEREQLSMLSYQEKEGE